MKARESYVQFLLAIAVVMVVTNDFFDRAWLLLAFPATPVVFAGSGALAAAVLDRAGSARAFFRQSARRLLAPFWLFGAVIVSVMLTVGWRADVGSGAAPFTLGTAWLWVLPISDPPASTQGLVWTSATWIVETSLWLLLLTPALLWLFHGWPLRLAAVPVTTLLLMTLGVLNVYGRTYDVVIQLCVDSCFWLLRFGYHDGRLFRIPLPAALAAGAGMMSAGLIYGLPRQNHFALASIYDVPLAGLLFGAGGVLVLLRIQPCFGRLERTPGRSVF